jgi:hypothetical protein
LWGVPGILRTLASDQILVLYACHEASFWDEVEAKTFAREMEKGT